MFYVIATRLTSTSSDLFTPLFTPPLVVLTLPLYLISHIAAQMLDIHAPIMIGATVWFAQPDALRGSLVETLREIRPTIFLGVPRVWEKIMEKMQAIGAKTTGMKVCVVVCVVVCVLCV